MGRKTAESIGVYTMQLDQWYPAEDSADSTRTSLDLHFLTHYNSTEFISCIQPWVYLEGARRNFCSI